MFLMERRNIPTVQWGDIAAASMTKVTWNIVFTSECWQVVGTPDTPGTAKHIMEVGGITKSFNTLDLCWALNILITYGHPVPYTS